jgi:Putative zinc-finger
MNCRQVEFYSLDYISGELAEVDRIQLEEHLSVCPSCRDLIDTEKKLSKELKGSAIPDPGNTYWENLENNILSRAIEKAEGDTLQVEYSVRRPRDIFYRYLIPLAAVLLILAVSFSITEKGTTPQILAIPGEYREPYNPRLIGNYATTVEIAGAEQDLDMDLLSTLILSAPGAASHNLALMLQLNNLGWGNK